MPISTDLCKCLFKKREIKETAYFSIMIFGQQIAIPSKFLSQGVVKTKQNKKTKKKIKKPTHNLLHTMAIHMRRRIQALG